MVSIVHSEETLFIGIDGGGSKCRAIISNVKGEIIGRGMGGPANPFYGVQRALNSILDASQNAIENAGLESDTIANIVAGIGLAGVNLPVLYESLQEWKHPFSHLYLTTDMDIANIGAHDGKEGAVIIVGTGSCGFVNSAGKKTMYGGYGFPIGDKASGAWIGLKAIEHTLLVLDGFEKECLLANKVCEFFSVASGLELSEKLVGRVSRQYAKIASLVFDCADADDIKANQIIEEGLEYISLLSHKLLETKTSRLCMIGGLSKYLLPRLDSKVANNFVEAKEQPEVGALHFAIQNWNNDNLKLA